MIKIKLKQYNSDCKTSEKSLKIDGELYMILSWDKEVKLKKGHLEKEVRGPCAILVKTLGTVLEEFTESQMGEHYEIGDGLYQLTNDNKWKEPELTLLYGL